MAIMVKNIGMALNDAGGDERESSKASSNLAKAV